MEEIRIKNNSQSHEDVIKNLYYWDEIEEKMQFHSHISITKSRNDWEKAVFTCLQIVYGPLGNRGIIVISFHQEYKEFFNQLQNALNFLIKERYARKL